MAGILCLLSGAGPIVSHCDELTNSRDMGTWGHLQTYWSERGKGSALNTDRVTRAQSRKDEKTLPVRTSYFPIKQATKSIQPKIARHKCINTTAGLNIILGNWNESVTGTPYRIGQGEVCSTYCVRLSYGGKLS